MGRPSGFVVADGGQQRYIQSAAMQFLGHNCADAADAEAAGAGFGPAHGFGHSVADDEDAGHSQFAWFWARHTE